MVLRRVYLLHLTLLVPLLCARHTTEWPVVNVVAWTLLAAAVAAVWALSGALVGERLVALGWVAPWAERIVRFFTERQPPSRSDDQWGCVVLVAALPVVALALVLAVAAWTVLVFLWTWWPLFVTTGMVADYLALIAALAYRGVFARVAAEREVAAAVRAVTEFYDAHEEDIGPRLPRDRFALELRGRFPEGTLPAAAWAATGALRAELEAHAEAGRSSRRELSAGLRRIDREIEEARRLIDRHRSSPIPDAGALEVPRLEEEIRDLEAERRELLEAAAASLTP